MTLRFDGRVAIVTGAGGGLGRAHALELARRGAKVIVNDLGGSLDGSGRSSEAADLVVAEIVAAGGTAFADGANVASPGEVARLVARATDLYGRVDIVINNAGILRDRSFPKMTEDDFDSVLNVHLKGAFNVTNACWPIMKSQQYGRVVMTTSASGLYGNFGQSNYSAAKLSLVGLMNALKIEGQKDNIHINAIAPVASTRMTESLLPPNVIELLKPEYVTPAVICLCEDEAPTGMIVCAGAGVFAAARMEEAEGVSLDLNSLNAEAVKEAWTEIADFSAAKPHSAVGEQTMKFIGKARRT